MRFFGSSPTVVSLLETLQRVTGTDQLLVRTMTLAQAWAGAATPEGASTTEAIGALDVEGFLPLSQSVRSRQIRTMRISRTPSSTCTVPSGTNPCLR